MTYPHPQQSIFTSGAGKNEGADHSERLKLIWADQGYAGQLVESLPIVCGWTLAIVRRSEPGFKVLPRPWVIEGTFTWLGRNRRSRQRIISRW